VGAEIAGEAFGFAQEVGVQWQFGDAEHGFAGLSCAEQFARAAYGKVFFGDAEAVGSFAHDAQAALCGVTQRWLVHEQAVGLFAAAPDPATQLVQLCEAEAFGVFDDHQGGIRHVHADFDDGSGNEQLCFARDEGRHCRLPFVVRHFAVDEGDPDVGQQGLQLFGGCGGVFAFEGVGFFDERTNPVGLPPVAAVGTDAGDDGVAFVVRHDVGLDGAAAGRQGVDDGQVEFAVEAHGEGARDGGGGEDELMCGVVGGFFLQLQALVHAEAVLFVDDDEGEAGVGDVFLKDGVGADDELRAAVGDGGERGAFFGGRHFAGERGDVDGKVCEQAADVGGMLFGEQFGRHHQYGLAAGGDGLQAGGEGDDGFAGADVALHEAHHRCRLGEVDGDFGADAFLCAGECVRQGGAEVAQERGVGRQGEGALVAHTGAGVLDGELVCAEFFEDEAAARGVAAVEQSIRAAVVWRTVQGGERGGQREVAGGGERVGLGQGGQDEVERFFDGALPARLAEAFDGGIDGVEVFGELRDLSGFEPGDFRMVNLVAARRPAGFAVVEAAPPGDEGFLLAGVVVEVEQFAHVARFVAYGDGEDAPLALEEVGVDDFAADLHGRAVAQGGNGGEVRAVFVAQRQVQDEFAQGGDTGAGEEFGGFFADVERGGQGEGEVGHGVWPQKGWYCHLSWCHRAVMNWARMWMGMMRGRYGAAEYCDMFGKGRGLCGFP